MFIILLNYFNVSLLTNLKNLKKFRVFSANLVFFEQVFFKDTFYKIHDAYAKDVFHRLMEVEKSKLKIKNRISKIIAILFSLFHHQ